MKLSFVIADKSSEFVKQLRTKEIKYQAQVYPEKTILLIAEKNYLLTLLQAVTDTGLELDAAEKILNKLVEKGIAEKNDGSDYYYFREYSDKYMKNIEKGLRKKTTVGDIIVTILIIITILAVFFLISKILWDLAQEHLARQIIE